MVPVLFEMEMPHKNGKSRAYLHDDEHSAFADEKEYLLGGVGWKVKSVEKRMETSFGKTEEVTVINLYNI